MRRSLARVLAVACVFVVAASARASAAPWQPPGIVPTHAVLGDVLAAYARASGENDAALASRHERWTYRHEALQLPVRLAVRGSAFRTSLAFDGLPYDAGKRAGRRWRADGNGIVHFVEADLQGDALDRVPQSLFPIDPATCTLVGEARLPAPVWVVRTDPPGDKPTFLYVDQATGSVVREMEHDGKRTVTTTFDRFAALANARRPRHWTIADENFGNIENRLDVTVDAIEPGAVAASELAFPERRVFAPAAPLAATVDLGATFKQDDEIDLDVDADGLRRSFVLDTGTESIAVDPVLLHNAALEHATVARLAIGPFVLQRASVLAYPFEARGIVGYDFFLGRVVEIDYLRKRVLVLSAADAEAAFADPRTTIVAANVDQGLPLVRAAFGPAAGDAFAIDTGSPHLYVMRPFVERFAKEIDAHWTRASASYVAEYLEGGIEVQPYRVPSFAFGAAAGTNVVVGAQIPTTRTDDLAIPFDGIIGTDVLGAFDLLFDYDHGRIGMRR
jgi:hypothetical protein